MKLKTRTIFLFLFCFSSSLSFAIDLEHLPTEKHTPENSILAWDFHGVLVQRQLWPMVKKMFSIIQSDEHIWQLIKTIPYALSEVYDIYYVQKICHTYEEVIEMLSNKYPAIEPHKTELLEIMTYYIPIEESIELLKKLKQAGYRNFLASNMGESTYQIMRNKYPYIFTNFDGIFLPQVIDHRTGFKIGKPCLDYFQAFRTFLEHRAIHTTTTIIFIDDNKHNIEAANSSKLGINVILFTSPCELQSYFKTHGILVDIFS